MIAGFQSEDPININGVSEGFEPLLWLPTGSKSCALYRFRHARTFSKFELAFWIRKFNYLVYYIFFPFNGKKNLIFLQESQI